MRSAELTDLVTPDAARRLRDFRASLLRALPEAVADVILFGSRARGDAHEESDYDVAVLLHGGPDGYHSTISDLAFALTMDGFDMQWVALPDEALSPPYTDRSELAARIALEGLPIR